jgi:putative cell wall-binding protein
MSHAGLRDRIVSACVVSVLLAAIFPVVGVAAGAVPASEDQRAEKAATQLYAKPVVGSDAGVLRPLDADDTIAGAVTLPASPAGGALDFATDTTDVYAVTLTAGTRFTLVLSGAATLSSDAYLYDPFAMDADATAALVGTLGDGYPKKLTFDVPAGLDGVYHLAIDAAGGSGSYAITWSSFPTPSGPDDDVPGVVPAGAMIEDALSDTTDVDDVYRVVLGEGQRLQAALTGAAGSDFDLHLYAPATEHVSDVLPVAGSAGSSSSEYFVYEVPADEAGTYYLAAHAADGAGAYSLTWTVEDVPVGAWESASAATPLAASSGTITNTLNRLTDANDFMSRSFAAGERLEIGLTGAAGTDFDVYIYGPNAADPIAWADGTTYPERITLDVTTSGVYYIEVVSFSGSGQYELTYATSLTPDWIGTVRLAGTDRFKTAVALSAATYAADSCPTVVLATGENFPDALSASGLAGVCESPILLVRKYTVPDDVFVELDRLGAENVVIVGGTPAVAPEVVTALQNEGLQVSRVSGLNRYATSAAVAEEVARLKGPLFAKAAFVARADVFADALALAPFAYSQGYPVLLTRSDALVTECSDTITSLGISEVYIAGSEKAVSAGVMSALNALPTVVAPVVRLAGSDRYSTAAVIAEYGLDFWWGSAAYVGVATGLNFPDALGGGAVCGARGGVMLLTAPTSLSTPASDFIGAHAQEVVETEVYGGSNVVSDVVKLQLDALLD